MDTGVLTGDPWGLTWGAALGRYGVSGSIGRFTAVLACLVVAAATGTSVAAAAQIPTHSSAPGSQVVVASTGSAHISGLVEGVNSARLNGVEVTIYDSTTWAVVASTETLGDGSYSVAVPSGSYYLGCHDPLKTHEDSYWWAWPGQTWSGTDRAAATILNVGSTDQRDVDVVMGNEFGSPITGTVVNSAASPLSGIQVAIYDGADSTAIESTLTAPDGTYSFFQGLAPTYILRFADPHGVYATVYTGQNGPLADRDWVSPAQTPGTRNLVMPAMAHINGVVTDPHGAPLSGIKVMVYDGYDEGSTWSPAIQPFASAVSGADGKYSIPTPPSTTAGRGFNVEFVDPTAAHSDGWYSASGYVPSFQYSSTVNVPASGVSGISAALPAAVHIRGRVTDGVSGIAGVIVHSGNSVAVDDMTTTASDGTYSISVGAGMTNLTFTDPTGNFLAGCYDVGGSVLPCWETLGFETPVTDQTGWDQVMTVAPRIHGRVTGASDEPLGGIVVGVYHRDYPPTLYNQTTTAPDGTYSIPVVPTEIGTSYAVGVYDPYRVHPTGWYNSSSGFEYYSSSPATGVTTSGADVVADVQMPEWPHISGTVSDLNGGLGGIQVNVIGLATGSGDFATTTAPDGTYAVDATPGTYAVGFVDTAGIYSPGYYNTIGLVATLGAGTHLTVGAAGIPDIDAVLTTMTPAVPGASTRVIAAAGEGSATVSWAAAVANGEAITAYTVTASDGTHTCGWTTGPLTCTVAGLTNNQPYTFTVTATNNEGTGPASGQSNAVTPVAPGPALNTYHTVDPVRLLDTRIGNGLSGKLTAGVPATFQITGRGGASNVPTGATAVTANVTIVKPSAASSVYLGPTPSAHPSTATINFNKADITAYGSTISLGSDGSMSVTYMAASGTTDLLVDVTGYFTPDATGDTYHPLTPARLLDSRIGNGQAKKAKLKANVPITFTIRGRGGVPANAVAVTGNVTVVNATNGWAIYVGPDPLIKPPASTMNFAKGQIRANSMTVALSSKGTLSATFLSSSGSTTDLVFDVTGYYTADLSGAKYVPITTPVSILDTRTGIGSSGKIAANTPRTFTVRGSGGVPDTATGITGIVAVYGQTSSWAVFVGPTPTAKPSTSAMNFLKGDNCSNGVTVALSPTGTLSVTFMSGAGNSTNVGIVVTGYFVP